MNKKYEHKEKENKLIFDPFVARALLRKKNKVVDCKPHKGYKDRTVMVFENTKKFRDDLAELYTEWSDVEVDTVKVEDPRVARYLLKRSMNLVDYKLPIDSDKTKMVFVFEKTPEFDAAFEEVAAEVKARDEARRKPEVEIEVDFEIEVDVDDEKLCGDLD